MMSPGTSVLIDYQPVGGVEYMRNQPTIPWMEGITEATPGDASSHTAIGFDGKLCW